MDRFQSKKYNEICHSYFRAKYLTHHSLHYPENEGNKNQKEVV